MRQTRPRSVVGAVLLAVVGTGICSTAFAYFTATGAGSASASVSKLSAPTISSATAAAGGTVALSWGPATPPGPGLVTYAVSRDGQTPAGSCPSLKSPEAVTSCTDAGVEVGTHTYTVTAKWRSWSVTSAGASAEVTIGAATHLTLSAGSTTPTASAADNLTITAKDSAGNTVPTYAGAHNLTFFGASASPGGTVPTVVNSSGAAVAFGSPTAIEFSSGVASVSSSKNGVMTLYNAGASSISVSDGSIASEPGLAVTVGPAVVSKLALGAGSTAPVAGSADNLTTTAQDAYGNTATSYTGSHSLTFSGASPSPGGNVPTVTNSTGTATAFGSPTAITFSGGMASVSGSSNGSMKLYRSGSTSLKVSDATLASAPLVATVAAATASKLSLSATSTTPSAGTADNLTATALDPYGNTATTYTNGHNLTFSGASASPGGSAPTVVNSSGAAVAFGSPTAIEFSSGVASVSSSKNGAMTLYNGGASSISVSDGSISTATGLAVTVSPAAAARLALTHVTVSAGNIAAGCLFACTVTKLGNNGTIKANVGVTDSFGNTVSALGSGHSVKVTSTGGTISGGALPMPSTGTAESATQFTYTSKSSGGFTDTITAASAEGVAYVSATATAIK